jgi:Ni,Fe-hydrogenase III small subunit
MINQRNTKTLLMLGVLMLIFQACAASGGTATESAPIMAGTQTVIPAATLVSELTPIPMKQSLAPPSSFGPDQEDFPKNYNPLSGQPVEDPQLLQIPAMLISVSHFPPVARPQAGLSFAPWVFEFYITEGATRFLSVFHGAYPEPEIPVTGDCKIRKGVFTQIREAQILGNQVWYDENKNGRQESYEKGIGGVCVNLYDEASQLIESTTTDTNGYYGFNVQPAKYTVEFILPEWLNFTTQNVGDDNADSDADQLSGQADADVQSTQLYLDAGLIPSEQLFPTPSKSMPLAEVGPIRSGRLLYADIAGFFQDSCLIYAFASKEVLSELPQCSMVTHEDAGGGSMMSLERMQAIAVDNKNHTRGGFNYANNLFTETMPKGGVPANQINVYVALLNQSGWTYDPLYGSWLRFIDNADNETAGQLHADTDRLTGRQLHFENFIFLFAEVDVISPTNLDIHLEQGDGGPALLFRDGLKYEIRWSTKAGEYEKTTGERRPMQFLNPDGSPAELKPGSTWIFVASPYSIVSDEGNNVWKLRYYAPAGSR